MFDDNATATAEPFILQLARRFIDMEAVALTRETFPSDKKPAEESFDTGLKRKLDRWGAEERWHAAIDAIDGLKAVILGFPAVNVSEATVKLAFALSEFHSILDVVQDPEIVERCKRLRRTLHSILTIFDRELPVSLEALGLGEWMSLHLDPWPNVAVAAEAQP